jgi:pectate lyase
MLIALSHQRSQLIALLVVLVAPITNCGSQGANSWDFGADEAGVTTASAGAAGASESSPTTGTSGGAVGGQSTLETGGAGAGGEVAGAGGALVGAGGSPGRGDAGTTTTDGITCTPQTWDASPVGWATESGGTFGGGNAAPIVVTSLSQFNTAVSGPRPAVVHVSGKIAGVVKVGSNKTILGLCGAEIDGGIDLSGSANVILRNIKIVGYNCTDSPSDCSGGNDAVHVDVRAGHLWFDHLDISDGSDGNLDITHGSDFVTISWTKFHYSGMRTGGHQFCNLIGHVDTNGPEDSGHLNVTFHHVWWADHVDQRMPRVRFGKVHLFNNLYTSAGDTACIEVGFDANIRSENNVFRGVSNVVDTTHANGASVIQSIGNQGTSASLGGPAFVPQYSYTLAPVSTVAADVMAGAGPK